MNAVNPTVVMTKMGRLGWSDPVKAERMLSRIPMKQFAGEQHAIGGGYCGVPAL